MIIGSRAALNTAGFNKPSGFESLAPRQDICYV